MTFRDFQEEFKPLELEIENDAELDRLEHIAAWVTPCCAAPLHRSNTLQAESPRERDTEEEEGERYAHAAFVCSFFGTPC